MKESELHEAALAYLARHAASAVGLRRVLERRLKRRGEEDEEAQAAIQRIVDRFRENGLLDDVRFANARAERLSRAGRSRRAIAAHLAQKGIDEATARAALPDDDLPSAVAFAKRRRIGPFAREDMDDAAKKKALGAMARAGFSYATCDRVLRMDLDTALDSLRDA